MVTKISAFTDGVTAVSTDRIAAARSPFGATDNRYVTPAYIKDYILGTANTWTATQTHSGHVLFSADNTYDIGATGATRPRDGFFGGNITVSGNYNTSSGSTALWASRGGIAFAADGQLQIFTNGFANNTILAQTSVNNLLGIGGATSSFPALKRSTTALEVKLADDSAYTHTIMATLARTAPVTETTDFTVAATTSYVISNRAAGNTATLPTASSFPGRELLIKTIQAQTVVSASSNVVPSTSATAGTAILPATDGAWALLVSDATNWVIMAANPLV